MTYEPFNATRPATLPAITATEAGEETTHATQTKGRGSSRAVPAGLGRDGRRQERLGLVERPNTAAEIRPEGIRAQVALGG